MPPSDATTTPVEHLERRVASLPERAMRRAVVVEALLARDAPELVQLLTDLLQRTQLGNGRARAVMQEMALEPTAFADLPYQRVCDAYALARDANQDHVASMFLSAANRNNPTVDEAFTGNDHLALPLGTRKAAARGRDRFRLDRLKHDRDWRVISALLDNPRIVERDVVQIAATRPTRPEVLEQIARHRRWASRYPVRKALACNPYTPAPVVRRLLPTLMRQDLRFILSTTSIEPDIRSQARVLLQSTPGAGAPPASGDGDD